MKLLSLFTKKMPNVSKRVKAVIEMVILLHKFIIMMFMHECIKKSESYPHMRQLHSKKKSAIFCLFARGGTDMEIDKDSRMGWANKQKETLDIDVS